MANELYYGDNLAVLREHVADESVDLVYLDPPFNSNASYNVLFREKTGEESPAQIRAFTDTWEWTQETESMKKCWICQEECNALSKEHIIPRFFGGIVYTEEFSCHECNQAIGQSEQQLNQLSVFMHYLDNVEGEPQSAIPTRGSRNKETKITYGENPKIELSSRGGARFEGWERPSGKISSEDKIWIPYQISLQIKNEDLHRSMLKAATALACHCGFQQALFGNALSYLAGNDSFMAELSPIDLGLPPEEVFAWVCIYAPPSYGLATMYGAVAYGPISYLYVLQRGISQGIVPFFAELNAYSRSLSVGTGSEAYKRWWLTTLEDTRRQAKLMQASRMGPFVVRNSLRSNLSVVEASKSDPAILHQDLYVPMHPLQATHGWAGRFESWLNSVKSEEMHSKFLREVAEFDSMAGQA